MSSQYLYIIIFVIFTFYLTLQQIQEAIVEFAKQCDKLPTCKSAIITLMSHGRLGIISGTDLEPVSLKWVEQQFYSSKCKSLKDKPKMFFFNACREGTHSILFIFISCYQ